MIAAPGLLAPRSRVAHLYRDCTAIRHESILTRNYAGRPVCRLCSTRQSVERDLLERCVCGADLSGPPHCERCHGEGVAMCEFECGPEPHDVACPDCAT